MIKFKRKNRVYLFIDYDSCDLYGLEFFGKISGHEAYVYKQGYYTHVNFAKEAMFCYYVNLEEFFYLLDNKKIEYVGHI